MDQRIFKQLIGKPLLWLSAFILVLSLGFGIVFPVSVITRRVDVSSLGQSWIVAAFCKTVFLATAVAAINFVASVFLAGFASRTSFLQFNRDSRLCTFFRQTMRSVISVPSIVWVAGWLIFLPVLRPAVEPYFGRDVGFVFVFSALLIFLLPWTLSELLDHLTLLPLDRVYIAESLGLNHYLLFKNIVWPFVRVRVFQSLLNGIQVTVTSYTLVRLLGGGPPVETLESLLVSGVQASWMSESELALAAVLQGSISIVVGAGHHWISRTLPLRHAQNLGFKNLKRLESKGSEWGCFIWTCWPLAFSLMPAVSLLGSVFGFSIRSVFTVDWRQWVDPIVHSCFVGGVSVLVFSVCSIAAWIFAMAVAPISRTWVLWIFSVASGVSTVVIAFGFYTFFIQKFDPFSASNTTIGVLLAWVLALPSSIQFAKVLIEKTSSETLEPLWIAFSLRCSRLRAFWLVLGNKLLPIFMVHAGICFVGGVTEFSVSSFFATQSGMPSLSASVGNAMAKYQGDAAVSVLSVVLVSIYFSFFLMGSGVLYVYRNKKF